LLPYANASADEAGERALRQALSVAREQDVKGWQLSAATSLARLLVSRAGAPKPAISSRRYEGQKRRKRCIQMRAEQSVPSPRRSQLSVSTALRGPGERSHLAEDVRTGDHDLATIGHPGNVQFDLGMPTHLMTDAPRVFISYSHDSAEHERRVLALANQLRREGVDAIIDQYEQFPREARPSWCAAEIRKATFVLTICTETYLRRVNGEKEPGIEHGVLRETRLIKDHPYAAGSVRRKFVPVLFADGSRDHVPDPVKGANIYQVEVADSYEDLYRLLTN
jgi:SEFIR domain